MQVATMATLPLLGETQGREYQMMLFQECIKSKKYGDFFKDEIAKGQFVIMDNGAAEGVNPSIEELIPMYKEIKPSEIILPDVVYDPLETLHRTRNAYKVLEANGMLDDFQIMAVPQGNNFKEWSECLRAFLNQPKITTIGVSKFVTPRFQAEMGEDANVRLECVSTILEMAKNLGREVQIHLLGCWNDPSEIAEIAGVFREQVRGTDSGIAYVYARANILYKPGVDRPDNDEIDFTNGTCNRELFITNMYNYTQTCQNKAI